VLLANFVDMPAPLSEPIAEGGLLYCAGDKPSDAIPPHSAAFYLVAAR
jgi:hypothetical protein